MDNQLDNGKLNIFNKSAFTVVGNPTITDDGIASGFATNTSYVSAPSAVIDFTKQWEVCFQMTTSSVTSAVQSPLFLNNGVNNGTYLVLARSNLIFRVLEGSLVVDALSLSANTNYYVKLGWNKIKYYLSISNDGNVWTTKELASTTAISNTIGGIYSIGCRKINTDWAFLGSIDLKQFSITVDGEEVFSGTKTINTNLKQYLPIVYECIIESETQQDSLSIEIDKMNTTYEQALMDQFVQFASLKVLPYYENIFNIVANPETESVQFRRERILSRMKMLTPPYTYYYLRTMLDGFFGKDRYKLYIDNNNFTIALESSASDSLWYHEIQVSITAVKPCNMIFINMPRLSTNLTVNEQISHSRIIYNYKLDGTWLLGLKPFITQKEDIVDKMANVHSIQQTFIDKTIEEWKTFFAKSVINDSYNVTQLNISKEDSNLIITYEVTSTMANSITNIKLIGADDTILISSNVFIPIDDYVTIKHIINLQEVLNG